MSDTETTKTNTDATSPTGDIKIFIDTFNKDFDTQLKSLLDAQQNYKNVYADAIKISTPKSGPWPNDPKVVTIGDLFKYTFPDIESGQFISPTRYNTGEYEAYAGWVKDLPNNKDEKISKMYQTISSGIRSNKDIENYQTLKKPGITNPSLWSPGQYYFDVFMSQMLSSYGPLKNPNGANAGEGAFGGNIIEGGWEKGWLKANGGSASVSNFTADGIGVTGSFGYFSFYEIISGGYVDTGIKYLMNDLTGIDINLDDADTKPPSSFSSLFTQYKSGPLSEFISVENGKINLKDPTFQIYEGVITDPLDKEIETLEALTNLTGYKFIGYYEHMLLYKAFVQAGDNYKSVVLPLREVREESPTPQTIPQVKVDSITTESEIQFKFNVEKVDTFVVVGGTVSPPMEFIIVPNDGSEFIIEDVFNDSDDLGEEYQEGEFQGNEEDLLKFEPGESLPAGVDVESLNNLKGFDPNNPDESLSTDSSSKYPVSKDKDANIKAIIKVAKQQGVKNKYTIAAILAIVSKESGFIPSGEASYAGTPAKRIRKIFGNRFKGYSDSEIDVIKKNPVRFFDIIYGGRYDNAPNEGFKYRGRGFNQITFKGNYAVYAKETGLDFVKDPDLLNTVDAAAAALIAYFKRNIKKAESGIRKRYNFTDINSFSNLNDATGAIYHANAGWGKSYSEVVADSTGGRKKAFNAAGPLYNTYQSQLA